VAGGGGGGASTTAPPHCAANGGGGGGGVGATASGYLPNICPGNNPSPSPAGGGTTRSGGIAGRESGPCIQYYNWYTLDATSGSLGKGGQGNCGGGGGYYGGGGSYSAGGGGSGYIDIGVENQENVQNDDRCFSNGWMVITPIKYNTVPTFQPTFQPTYRQPIKSSVSALYAVAGTTIVFAFTAAVFAHVKMRYINEVLQPNLLESMCSTGLVGMELVNDIYLVSIFLSIVGDETPAYIGLAFIIIFGRLLHLFVTCYVLRSSIGSAQTYSNLLHATAVLEIERFGNFKLITTPP
jgi:hypothetical protein